MAKYEEQYGNSPIPAMEETENVSNISILMPFRLTKMSKSTLNFMNCLNNVPLDM